MRGRLRRAAQGAAVVVPVALGIPLAVDGAATIYSGYSSMWWPSTNAVVTRFCAVPVHPQEGEGAHDSDESIQNENEDRKRDERLPSEEDTHAMNAWRRVQRRIDRLLNGKHTMDFAVEFEYTLPDGKTYVGTSKKDANFPGRLDLECPSCMMQAETIVDFFGQPGKTFLLFYDPRTTTTSRSLHSLTTRKEKDSDLEEGRYPLYSIDAGVVAPTAYERLALGTSLVGVGLLGISPKSQSWVQLLTTQRGLFPAFCIAVASGFSAFGLSLLLESRLTKAEEERQRQDTP